MERRVIVASGLDTCEGNGTKMIDFPDPKSGITSTYLLNSRGVQELTWFKQKFSSWFVGDSVIQDGGLYLGTPVDVLLLLLPLLERAREAGTFCDFEHILGGAVPPATAALLAPLALGQLECICDWKEAEGLRYFRLSEAKALAWLRLKVAQAAAALQAAHSDTFAAFDAPSLGAYAAGIVGEYLSAAWEAKLAASLGLPGASQAGAPPSAMPAGVPANYDACEAFTPSEPKRARFDPKEAAKAKARAASAAVREAKRAKEASTMRKMSSFFTKATS